jgi:hypothetical protein
MKQHIFQLILLIALIGILYFFLKDQSFSGVKTALENSGVSMPAQNDINTNNNATGTEQVEGSTTESDLLLDRREDLFGKLVSTRENATYTPDDPAALKKGPKYIVSNGYVMNPDAFYASPTAPAPTENTLEGFLNATNTSPSKKTYSTSTGAITVVTTTTSLKGSKDLVNTGYLSSKNGVAFKIDKDWKVTDSEGIIAIRNVGSDGQSRIIITFSKGDSVITHDNENGDFALSYDSATDSWVDFSNPVDPLYQTNAGQPVFKATPKIETRVVVLDAKSFAIVNLVGSGKTSAIDRFTKTIGEFAGN